MVITFDKLATIIPGNKKKLPPVQQTFSFHSDLCLNIGKDKKVIDLVHLQALQKITFRYNVCVAGIISSNFTCLNKKNENVSLRVT